MKIEIGKRIKILGVPVDFIDRKTVITRIEDFIKSGKPHFLSFINPEIVMKCRQVPELKQAIENADLIAPDGIGILWAARLFGYPLPERVTGTDIMYDIAKLSDLKKYSIYFLGAAPGVVDEAVYNLRKKYPSVNIVGYHHGYFSDDEEIVNEIECLNPDILVVCLGMVKQELWIKRHMEKLKVPVSFGNGGALDFVSGKAIRAPLWMRRIGLEWFFRLIHDFKWIRIKRQCILIKFILLVINRFFNQYNRNKI